MVTHPIADLMLAHFAARLAVLHDEAAELQWQATEPTDPGPRERHCRQREIIQVVAEIDRAVEVIRAVVAEGAGAEVGVAAGMTVGGPVWFASGE